MTEPQPDLREQSSDEIRRDMLAAISGYAAPVIADLAARWSERWTEDQFIAQWGKTLGDLITAVRREEATARQAEVDGLRTAARTAAVSLRDTAERVEQQRTVNAAALRAAATALDEITGPKGS